MKTLLRNVVPILFMTMVLTIKGYSGSSSSGSEAATSQKMTPAQAQELMNRLEELKAMEPEKMTKTEKKAVRKEVKQIKKAMRDYNGVYISFGALIIIVLLLILIF